MTAIHQSALVLFSGGQDSTTCLAHALQRYPRVETLGFNYGQRHHIEMQARVQVLQRISDALPRARDRLGPDHVLDLAVLGQVSETSLTRDMAFKVSESGLPNTFVPGRNLLFLTLAAALAYRRDLQVLVTGVCETDFSGYPDCRDDTMKAMQLALSLGMDRRILIETPLMWIDKAETWAMAHQLGGDALVQLIVEHSHTERAFELLFTHEDMAAVAFAIAIRVLQHADAIALPAAAAVTTVIDAFGDPHAARVIDVHVRRIEKLGRSGPDGDFEAFGHLKHGRLQMLRFGSRRIKSGLVVIGRESRLGDLKRTFFLFRFVRLGGDEHERRGDREGGEEVFSGQHGWRGGGNAKRPGLLRRGACRGHKRRARKDVVELLGPPVAAEEDLP